MKYPKQLTAGKEGEVRNVPVVQWLRLHASITGGTDSVPGQGTKIYMTRGATKKKEKKREKLDNSNTVPN